MKRCENFNFEELQSTPQTRNFPDVIESLKHVAIKLQVDVIILMYNKNRLQNDDIVEGIVCKLINSQSKHNRECS